LHQLPHRVSKDLLWRGLDKPLIAGNLRLFHATRALRGLDRNRHVCIVFVHFRSFSSAASEAAKSCSVIPRANGYLNPEEPSLNAVLLSQVGNAPNVDGFMTAREWPQYNLKSNGSSCRLVRQV
jgi:hypothetical protein